MNLQQYKEYAPTLLRATLGLMFVIAGILKLMNPAAIIRMLGELGFPFPLLWGWLLLISELGFGAAVLLGWKLEYTVWPLVVVIIVAAAWVYVPQIVSNPAIVISVFFHLVSVAGLISLAMTGPGKWAVG